MHYLALFLAGFTFGYPFTSIVARFTKKHDFKIHFRGIHLHHSRMGLILITAELVFFIGQVFVGVIHLPLGIYPSCLGGFLAMLVQHIRSEGHI